jgi:hypothetical protein
MSIHSCSYYCDRPECIKAQLDELVKKLEPADDSAAYHGWVLREVLFDNGEPVGHREPQPAREWVGLTNEELVSSYMNVGDKEWAIGGMRDATKFAHTIEEKLKEKNT